MVFLLVIAAFLVNVVYLSYFYALMGVIERSAPVYWAEIGHPKSFSGRDVSSVLNNLYTKRMKEELGEDNSRKLMAVRVLLPLATAMAATAIIVVSKSLE